jgi:hypothetical protein
MAHARVALLVGFISVGCQASASPAPAVPDPAVPAAATSARPADGAAGASFDGTRWGTFHSKRFELSLALPDGAAWRIDDHGSHWLKAEHPPSHSTLWLRVWGEDQVTTRKDCYARARDWNPKLPDLEGAELIDDRVRRLWGPYDARVAAGMRPSDRSSPRDRGFVVAVVGELRRCMVVVYETEASGQVAPMAIADRLAFVSDRVLPQVQLDPSLAPPRQPLRGVGVSKDR